MDLPQLFFELSHKVRFKIFKDLLRGGMKHGQLMEELDLTKGEISRHLRRMQEMGLIEKSKKSIYELTGFGKEFSVVIPYAENLVKFSTFIQSHSRESVEDGYFFNIFSAPNLELRVDAVENIGSWINIIDEAERFIFAMTDKEQIAWNRIMNRLIVENGMDIKLIISPQSFFDNINADQFKHINSKLDGKDSSFLEKIRLSKACSGIALTVTDKGVFIFLPSGSSIDYHQAIFGESREILDLATKLFLGFWSEAKIIESSSVEKGSCSFRVQSVFGEKGED